MTKYYGFVKTTLCTGCECVVYTCDDYQNGTMRMVDKGDIVIMDDITAKQFEEKNLRTLISNYTPKPKENVYVVPGSVLAHDDIRKQYTIKYSYKDADFAIIHPMDSVSYRNGMRYDMIAYDPQIKRVGIFLSWFAQCRKFNTLNDVFEKMFGHKSGLENVVYDIKNMYYDRLYTMRSFTDIHNEILLRSLSKPLIFDTDLKLEGENPVTLDVLSIVEKAANKPYSQDSISTLILALQSLNQCNWRAYLGTIRYVFSNIRDHGYGTYRELRKSSLPKAIRLLYDSSRETPKGFISEDDYNLCMDWICNKLGMSRDRIIFTTLQSIHEKENKSNLSTYVFENLMNMDVRVKVRPYKEFQGNEEKV